MSMDDGLLISLMLVGCIIFILCLILVLAAIIYKLVEIIRNLVWSIEGFWYRHSHKKNQVRVRKENTNEET